jgi:hypothetical protein
MHHEIEWFFATTLEKNWNTTFREIPSPWDPRRVPNVESEGPGSEQGKVTANPRRIQNRINPRHAAMLDAFV